MANPLIPQGTLNRLKASLVWTSLPALNITSPFLMKEGISLALEGQATTSLPSMTGIVQSPEPFMLCRLTAHLIKAQPFSNSYKKRMEVSTLMGDCSIRVDSATMDVYQVSNCAIMGVEPFTGSGQEAGWTIMFMGAYYINQTLWN